jgi:serine protease Do
VLDTDYITVTLNDGRKFKGELLGADPQLEVAVLKIDAVETPHFVLEEHVQADVGTRVLAFSNLFGVATGNEPASVQHGAVSAKVPLAARRGAFESPYRGRAYILDAMTNNPGAAGGALVNSQGMLLGVLGKELRSSLANSWMNYAIPIDQLLGPVNEMRSGDYVARGGENPAQKPKKSLKLNSLGIVLVPDVLERTPPFIDDIRPASPAALAGLRPDDLLLFVGDRLVQSCKALQAELQYVDSEDEVSLTVMRGQELLNVLLKAPPEEQGEN